MNDSAAMTVGHVDAGLAERAIIGGDLARLSPADRTSYYLRVCESVGLNPLTRPFEYIVLNGKLTLYARRDCADQLRKIHGVSVRILGRETTEDGMHIVTAQARTRDGREDESTGAVSLHGLRGEALANALMKAETKAKRRVTLSICGMGWSDESEVDDIPEARRVEPDPAATEDVVLAALDRAVAEGIDAGMSGDSDAAKRVLDGFRRWMASKGVAQEPGARAVVQWRERVAAGLAARRKAAEPQPVDAAAAAGLP